MTGAWALNALDESERARVEGYLDQDPAAADEARSFEETAGELARGLEPVTPRPELKDSLMARIAQTRQLPPEPAQDSQDTPHDAPRPVHTHRAAESPADPSSEGVRDGDVVSLDRYRSSARRTRWLAVAAAALMVTTVTGVGLWSTERAAQEDSQATIEAMESAQAEAEQEQQMVSTIMAADDAAHMTVPAETGGALNLMYSRAEQAMLVQPADLPDLPSDSTYQLWLIDDEGARSAGLVTGSDQAVMVSDEIPADGQLGLTVEPSGGSEQPTLPVVAAGDL
nr:anti-sigma factor [Brachybacterium sacelli]